MNNIRLLPNTKHIDLIEREFQKTTEPLILSIDPGNNCGYAATIIPKNEKFQFDKLIFNVGQLDLSCGPYDSGPSKFVRLRHFLSILNPSVIFFEDVRYQPADTQNMTVQQAVARVSGPTEFFGGFKSHISEWGETHKIATIPVPIAHIKKIATGKGNSSKEELIKAANQRFNATFDTINYDKKGHDNIVDALWALVYGLENYSFGIVGVEKPFEHVPISLTKII